MSLSRHAISNYAPYIGARYSFSRQRNRFTSVIATVSMLGMVLGVASLIVVLSIMNGFSGELRARILSLVPHGYVESRDNTIGDWQALSSRIESQPGILAVAPYITEKVILVSGGQLRGAVLTGIDPVLQGAVSRLADSIVAGSLDSLKEDNFDVVLGVSLANLLGVSPGDHVNVTVPRLTVTPLGLFPRSKRLRVVGLFEIGAQQDAYQAYVSLRTGRILLGGDKGVQGLQVATEGLFQAPDIMRALDKFLEEQYVVQDWSQTQGSLFNAVKMEKMMVSLLLLSVVAVAAFNIVSTLVMSVTEKRRDIAVLRTMGARATGVMAIFVAHGLALACVGIAAGVMIGVLLSSNIAAIIAGIEAMLGVKLFDPTVYFISELPAQLQWFDVAVVALASLVLSLVATLYPAWRASQISPAEVLRYE
ncbi:MAG: lipoprotein-releasing ABC transporter permease subunit [Halioglobus sp.]|nr:lipoprotein-releasing ABC transporter permease subunit [Halioglobus sp.]